MGSEKHRQIQNAQTSDEQHACGQCLHCELEVRTYAADIVKNPEHENQNSREQDGSQSVEGKPTLENLISPAYENAGGGTKQEGKKNGDPTEAWKWSVMQVTIKRG